MEELVGWTGRKKSLILFYQSPGIIRPKLNWDFGNKLICNLAQGYTSNDWPTVTMLSNVKAHWPWSFRPTVAHLSLQVIPHHVTLSEVGWHLSVEVLMQVAGLDWLTSWGGANKHSSRWLTGATPQSCQDFGIVGFLSYVRGDSWLWSDISQTALVDMLLLMCTNPNCKNKHQFYCRLIVGP